MTPEHDFLSLDELEGLPLLKRLCWTKRKMIALIQTGHLVGHYDTTESCWMTTVADIRNCLKLRNEAILRQIIDVNELDNLV